MDTISVNKNNRLFWLGRYAERVYQGILIVHKVQDDLLDGDGVDMPSLCQQLGLDVQFETVEEFFQRYTFDRALPDSILSSADYMIGNGMVLREVLGSQTLSYLQMAVTALESAASSNSCGVQSQWVMDDIMAFRGSYGEYIASEEIRNIIRCGASVERLGTMLRFDVDDETLCKELHKLINRLYKTHLVYEKEKLKCINAFAFSEEEQTSRDGLLDSVESLFLI